MAWNFTVMKDDMTAMAQKFGVDPKAAMSFTSSLGMMPMSSFMKGTATAVVTMALGSLVGGWAYREDEVARPAAARAV